MTVTTPPDTGKTAPPADIPVVINEGDIVTGAEALLESLRREGVDTIFGYPGGANLWLYRHLPKFSDIHHVLVRHEQGATHMADGYARARRGKAGVVFATSGPGALNCVTGIATAQYDSVPLVVVTGQVATVAVGTDAFQESDVIGVTMPIVKHSYLIQDIESVPRIVREAFHIATTGRPGVVLIDMPKDIQNQKAAFAWPPDPIRLRSYNPTIRGNPLQIRKAAQLIDEAKRPCMLAGRGVLISQGEDELLELSRRASIPVGWTLLGTGTYPVGDELSLHMVGFMGAGYTNKAVLGCDLLIMVGMRADDRVTTRIDSFAPQVENIIHIDIDPAEIGKNVRPTLPIVGDAKQVLGEIAKLVQPKRLDSWITQIERWKEEHPIRFRRNTGVLQPQDVLLEMYRLCESDAIVVADVGQNQIWGALWWDFKGSGLYLNSGGAGTMGFAFPASLGARLGRPDKTVWCIAGEGGFVMTMQELATAVQENIDVKIVILNNHCLGMVRQFQDDYYEGVRSAVDLTVGPDFVKLADAFGMPGWRTDSIDEVPAILARMAAHPGPCIGEFTIDPEANVRPIIPLGAGLPDFVEEAVEEGF
ncbi:MAG TPA: biosynthetic-type acetolactate synthase large subunit [Candidatus Dormibacteraeota bacterium]|jgi:acetolactate synthase-1/2/3 large subunit|nr:biosynthetic-type acetolactate synthase large subunit [Candidatus Dormibacteraeota bacterium]